MKIGILTFHRALNYGAVLQAYALCEAVNCLPGREAEIVDYRCRAVEDCYRPFAVVGPRTPKNFLITLLTVCNRVEKAKKFCAFLKKRMRISTHSYTLKNVTEMEPLYDVLIVGSDQVFNDVCAGFDGTYFLDFVKEREKKNSYAASFGFDEIPSGLEEQYRQRLKDFSHLSVREEQGRSIIQKLLGQDAEVNIDPTFLLRKDEWEKIAKRPKLKKYILVYLLQPSSTIFEFVRQLACRTGCTPVLMHLHFFKPNGIRQITTASPEEFLGYFQEAQYVVTNSFHGTAFSVIFHKKFFLEYQHTQAARNSRLENLLNTIHLTDRVICTGNFEQQVNACDRDIPYDKIESLLDEQRQRAMDYLSGLQRSQNQEKC